MENKKQTTYIITLNVKYKDMSYRDEYISCIDDIDAMNTYDDYKKYCNNTYDIPEEVPECFWDNIWLIKTCLEVIHSNGKFSKQICAEINHSITFPYEELKIEPI